MAYCVHCGVKLGEAEKTCPLCGTEVCDPSATPGDKPPTPAFPAYSEEQKLKLSRRYAVSLLSLLLLVPAGLCILLDILSGGISWSIYPAGVLVLIWIATVVPLLIRKHRLYSTILITGATLAAYLAMIEALSGTSGWFLPIVLPSLALAILMVCFTIWLIRSKRIRLLRLMSVIAMEIGILCLAIEGLCVFSGIEASLTWSLFVVMPCGFLSLLLYVVSTNKALSTELRRRFHF